MHRLGLTTIFGILLAAATASAQNRLKDLPMTPMVQLANKEDSCCCQEGERGHYVKLVKRRVDCRGEKGKCIAKEACE